ncbi:MAG: MATE family efflux transporter [Eubacteriales bacterium]|nr:MATE family efflux transporter [Eubacteriales bacterium]
MSESIKLNKMGTKAMFPLIMSMSLPAMFSMLIQALYNIVDSIFVSQISSDALNAVSLAYPLQMVMFSFSIGTAIGVNSLIARQLGAKRFDEANSAATHGIVLAVFSWLLFVLVGIFFSDTFISLFTDDSVILEYGTQYLSIVLMASFGCMVSIMCEKTLQATGNMIVPMLTQLLGAVVNIILDPLLIHGYWIFPRLEVVGAALATVIAQIISMLFIVLILITRKQAVKISFRKFRIRLSVIKNIYIVGFPAIIMQCIGSVMVSGINAIISAFASTIAIREAYINVFGIYFKLQSFVFMPVFGLSQGTSPIIGYNFGAKNKKRMFSALKLGLIIAAIIMTLGLLLFQFASPFLLSLFEADELTVELGVSAFRIISLCFVPAAVGISFSTLFQAVGKGVRSMLLSIMRQLIVLLPAAFILAQFSLESMWFAFPIAEIFALVVAVLFFINLVKKDFKKLDAPAAD